MSSERMIEPDMTSSLSGKTIIVTGANNGLGRETAKELARRGARVILACRSAAKAELARAEIVAETNNEHVFVRILDLGSLPSVRKFADDFNSTEERLDILVNNAAVNAAERSLTEQGFEIDFGTNHLGHFYLTQLLLDKLKASAPSRVVVVASEAHRLEGKLDFNDLQLEKNWGFFGAYGKSKTANILFALHLAKILEGTNVTTYSLHPGVIKTGLLDSANEKKSCCFLCCLRCFLSTQTVSVEEGIQTTIYCCTEESIANQSGLYYSKCKLDKPEKYARDPALAERLWLVSEQLINSALNSNCHDS